MKIHLMLEGDIRLGKSQIIRQSLLPYGDLSGGFFVQRIYVGESYQGFTVNSLGNMETYVLEKHVQNLSEVEPFFYRSGSRWKVRGEVFIKTVTNALRRAEAQGKKIILMDEIGGVELGKFITAARGKCWSWMMKGKFGR
ncbi:nucleoside-triphosphatase [Candidatus Contubernalis alkaliaceticus]|uniref:nucleoside-triphosphatase n=1 Tax=Candidatus Contubernalis alkaliaceticus TaxID=338645 RepID=UPI001F4C4695|nr:nucleoside-triphosphatase [Candidatus Contubernalis alkalaceticus]UNC91353.1 hypothetical protein HUE98_04165 [Candidatus Contubernalis alkalaceticus]